MPKTLPEVRALTLEETKNVQMRPEGGRVHQVHQERQGRDCKIAYNIE